MNQVSFIGTVLNAQGCAVSVILYQNGLPLWVHHYFSSFVYPAMLPPDTYTVTITGITQGTFVFDIQGASSVDRPVPNNYQSSISDVFNLQVQ